MRFNYVLCLFLVFMTACDAGKLNKFAANLGRNIQEKYDNLSSNTPDLASSKPEQTPLEEANSTLKDINQTYKDTKENVRATKQSISEGVKDAKQTAKKYARKLPRSEKEANQMIIAFAEKYFGGWRGIFRKSSRQSVNDSGGSNKSSKLTANRLR